MPRKIIATVSGQTLMLAIVLHKQKRFKVLNDTASHYCFPLQLSRILGLAGSKG